MAEHVHTEPFEGPAGGWGSVQGIEAISLREKINPTTVGRQLQRQNKPGGFVCVSCAWGRPTETHIFEFCENGAKATIWEMTSRRATPDFFAAHTLSELCGWSDYDIEQAGRLTHPLRYDPATDRYLETSWETAFAEIGRELKALDPKSTVFYSSGRTSLETSYMYALFARLYGHNNLPDSSNMCHETTSVALPKSLGVSVGTVVMDDFKQTDCIFFFGQNVGSNSPRMLHDLEDARKRDVPIITFNPLKERGLERFVNPQSFTEMATGHATQISTQYHQVKAGGDIAALTGLCKSLIERDDKGRTNGGGRVLDAAFIAEHTHGFDEFAAFCRQTSWADIEKNSGLTQAALEGAADVYAASNAVIGIYGMGLTQHRRGIDNVQMFCNFLLLRGNIGKPGAGACPVRGHSNVQGQRTVGITENPALVPLDRLKAQYGFEPPRQRGLTTVEVCEGVMNGRVRAFLGLGGNFARAAPDSARLATAWPRLRLAVHIATRPNLTHMVPGEITYLLPCLGRIERDVQASGPQAVAIEDSTSCVHSSTGDHEPASEHLLSEPRIVAELAKATLAPNPRIDWDAWVADYAKVRDAIEETYPDQFKDFNTRMWNQTGFHRPNAARERKWNTDTGKANFAVPHALSATGFQDAPDVLRLITLRSNDQFNTTVYGYDDRFRGIRGTRQVVLMNRADMDRFGLSEDEEVSLSTKADDQVSRVLGGLRVVPYDIPQGCIGAYYPECNLLIPVWHYAEGSKVPAAKSVPVQVLKGG